MINNNIPSKQHKILVGMVDQSDEYHRGWNDYFDRKGPHTAKQTADYSRGHADARAVEDWLGFSHKNKRPNLKLVVNND